MQWSGVHIHISEAVRHNSRNAFYETNLPGMDELVAGNFDGINEIVHADGIFASFIEEDVEIELIVVVRRIVTVRAVADFTVFDRFYKLLLLFNHMFGLFRKEFFELLVLFQ
jgi:hypothetical protein